MILADLQGVLDESFAAIVEQRGVNPPLFQLPRGLPDGGAIYGIVFNVRGVAVNGLAMVPPSPYTVNKQLVLRNVSVHDIAVEVSEIVALATPSGAAQIDAVGAVFDYKAAMSPEGNFVGNPLANAQLFVHRYRTCFPPWLSTRRSNLQPWAVNWAASTGPLSSSENAFVCSGDIMSHVSKGW